MPSEISTNQHCVRLSADFIFSHLRTCGLARRGLALRSPRQALSSGNARVSYFIWHWPVIGSQPTIRESTVGRAANQGTFTFCCRLNLFPFESPAHRGSSPIKTRSLAAPALRAHGAIPHRLAIDLFPPSKLTLFLLSKTTSNAVRSGGISQFLGDWRPDTLPLTKWRRMVSASVASHAFAWAGDAFRIVPGKRSWLVVLARRLGKCSFPSAYQIYPPPRRHGPWPR